MLYNEAKEEYFKTNFLGKKIKIYKTNYKTNCKMNEVLK